MGDAITAAWATDGLIWLFGIALLAGLVRGFAGFGSAMIYMPLASTILPPVTALATMVIFDVIGPLPNVPRAWREGRRAEVKLLVMGAAIGLPLGLWVLTRLPPEPFRWAVSLVVLGLLAVLLTGWRYGGPRGRPVIFGTGMIGGGLAGSTGLAGPPVVLLYVAGRDREAVIRANMILYLFFGDLVTVALLFGTGLVAGPTLALGLMLAPVYLGGNVLGAWIFHKEAERFYRRVAYLLIAGSAVLSLPLFS
ncbi:sulfite exporter TauE/SafE family protein [Aestuariibius sp. 2305UL40-4]|uniref:sulfite exporter TauE/SafE family protein n=1 Tax=Aestuariibius violaceus TaxID=3234132 RepID=UPI00345EB72B